MDKIAGTMVGFIDKTGQALGLAQDLVKNAESEKKAASQLIPDLVAQLKEAKLISASHEKLATQELGNHANALEILANVVTVMSDRVKEAAANRVALVQGELVPDNSGNKSASEDADFALLRLAPGLASKYS